jgi:multiple sugar transport system substrate-binding protein
MNKKRVSRREFLRLGAAATGMMLLAGCGSPAAPAEAPKEEAPKQEEAAEEAPKEEPPTEKEAGSSAPATEATQVRFAGFDWFAYVPGVQWNQWNQEKAFPVFQETNSDIQLSWEPLGDGWESKTLTQMAAGTAPDLISTWPPIINTWAEKKQLLDLQPFVDRDLPKADEMFIKEAWEQTWDTVNGIRMGLIIDQDITSVYYNKAAFEEAGVSLPTQDWTIDDYVAAAEALTQKDSSGQITRWGGQLRPDFWLGYFYYVEAFGGQVRDDDTQMKCLLGEPAAQEALEWVRHGMWDLNYFVQNNQLAGTGIPNTWSGALPAGVLAFAERSADQFFSMSEGMPEGGWDIAHIPQTPKGRACMGAPDLVVIYKEVTTRGNQEAAWKALKWLGAEEWYQEKVASESGRIPGLLSATQKWPATLRSLDARLEQVRLETVLEQIDMGYARRPPIFRFQSVAEELINPAMEQIYVEGTASVNILQEVAQKVTDAQQEALNRAGG